MKTTDDRIKNIEQEIETIKARIYQLGCKIINTDTDEVVVPTDELNPSLWTGERFPAQIVGDNQDGSYQAKRLIAAGGNTFTDDPEDTATITIYYVPERTSYTGALSIGDIVVVYFDGFDSSGNPIYHVY